jgi:hypothetical protein
MAHGAFEDAVEFRAPPSAFRSFAKWVGRLLAIGLATLAVAYYVPLYRAHRLLLVEFARATSERDAASRVLADTRRSLEKETEARALLQAKNDHETERAARSKTELDHAVATVRERLGSRIDKGTFAALARDGKVVVSFSDSSAAAVESPPASLALRLGLCEIQRALASAVPGSSVEVAVFPSEGDKGWDDRALRAARVVEALETSCRVGTGSATAVVRGDSAPSGTALELRAVPRAP